jgi:hypothetical protein
MHLKAVRQDSRGVDDQERGTLQVRCETEIPYGCTIVGFNCDKSLLCSSRGMKANSKLYSTLCRICYTSFPAILFLDTLFHNSNDHSRQNIHKSNDK